MNNRSILMKIVLAIREKRNRDTTRVILINAEYWLYTNTADGVEKCVKNNDRVKKDKFIHNNFFHAVTCLQICNICSLRTDHYTVPLLLSDSSYWFSKISSSEYFCYAGFADNCKIEGSYGHVLYEINILFLTKFLFLLGVWL